METGPDRYAYNRITKDYDVYRCGVMVNKNTKDIPYCFYRQMGLDETVLWDYFYVPDTDLGLNIYNKIKNIPYIFIHDTSSTGKVFDFNNICNELKINKKDSKE